MSWMLDEYQLLRCFGAIDRTKLQSRGLKALRDKAMLDPRAALRYAIYVKQGPWPEGEPIIATDGQWSLQYATEVLDNHRFPAGEEAIRNNGEAAETYAIEVLDKAWPEAEANIFDPKQNRNPSSYYDLFLKKEDYDDLPEAVQQWLIVENGACDGCGKALSSSNRDIWHTSDSDAEFCSERCAEKEAEFQHENDLEYWTEDAMSELDPKPTPERITEAQEYIKHHHRWLEGPDDVVRALVDGDFIPDPDEEDDEDEAE